MPETQTCAWQFLDPIDAPGGTFRVADPQSVSALYFPLFNLAGMMSAITPEAKGDIKVQQHAFLTEPQVTENLPQTNNSRNFWIKTETGEVWSLTGVSAEERGQNARELTVAARDVIGKPGEFLIEARHASLGLTAHCLYFVPATPDRAEIQIITLENQSCESIEFEATGAVPLFGRSADNLRDHRQVTTLLNRVEKGDDHLFLIPTMSFDERGHRPGNTVYFAKALDDSGHLPAGVMGDLETYIGEGGSLDAPHQIYRDLPFRDPENLDGRQAIAAFRFAKRILKAKERAVYVLILGIAGSRDEARSILDRWGSVPEMHKVLEQTRAFWKEQAGRLQIATGDPVFDNWMVWVGLQPLMRRIFGCSFLPDFGYGRGGRGWRDLWQDCLGLILTHPMDARDLLLNNIQGVRIDGSNATIIGQDAGSFIADRNNIPRTWMDHGVWPLLTLKFYMDQTGDYKILTENRSFFRDALTFRCKRLDHKFTATPGLRLLQADGGVFAAPILLHLCLQNLTQFYNRGAHGNIRLEDADWNDGLDMASAKGESVPFTTVYADNLEALSNLCEILYNKDLMKKMNVPEAFMILVEGADSGNPGELRQVLERYLDAVAPGLSANSCTLDLQTLSKILRRKGMTLKAEVREREFMDCEGYRYFNGYYNNDGARVEGRVEGTPQMSLTAQVFPVMMGCATEAQVSDVFQAAHALLKDPEHGGYRLNTRFQGPMLNLGRAYSFSYGDKENGAVFSHMAVMFGNALYRRGRVTEGFEVLNSLFLMASRTATSRIFPCIPEYFNRAGRGRYCYITGSAAWLVMTWVIEVFGIRGASGNLVFQPKLLARQWQNSETLCLSTLFQGVAVQVGYRNPRRLDFGSYAVREILLNGQKLDFRWEAPRAIPDAGWLSKTVAPYRFNVLLDA